MPLFLVPIRHFRFIDGPPGRDRFPAPLVLHLEFAPSDAFGCAGDARTTLPRGVAASILWNPDDDSVQLEGDYIDRVEVGYDISAAGKITFSGNVATLQATVSDLDEAARAASSACQLLPALIACHFRTFVWIRAAHGTLAGATHKYALARTQIQLFPTTREVQEERLARATTFWSMAQPGHTRLLAALLYYRHALRLAQIGPEREQFVGEIILNLAKTVEVLFSDKRDAVRQELQRLGLEASFVEERLIPILLLRSQLDVAHPAISPRSTEERDSVTLFIHEATDAVARMLEEVEARLLSRQYDLPVHHEGRSSTDKVLASILRYIKRKGWPS